MAYGTAESLSLLIRVAIESLVVFSCLTLLECNQNVYSNAKVKPLIVASFITLLVGFGMTLVANSDLSGDETVHLRSAHIFAIKFGSRLSALTPISAANAETVYRIVTLLLLSSCLIFLVLIWLYYTQNKSDRFFVPILTILGTRSLVVILTGGNGEPYPQLRSLINGLVTSIFGLNRYSICLIGVSSLIAMLYYFHKSKTISRTSFWLVVYLTVVMFVSGSLFWGAFYLEQSIFTFSTITPLLLRLTLGRSDLSPTEGLNWLIILALTSLIRSVVVIPLLVLFAYLVIHRIVRGRLLLNAFAILCVALPSTLQLISTPSNARYAYGFASVIGDNQSLPARLYYFLKNGIVIDVISFHSGVLVLAFYLISALVIHFVAVRPSLRVTTFWISLQLLLFVSFFSLRTDHLGIERYQIEYVLPFFFSAVITCFSFACDKLFTHGFRAVQIVGLLSAATLVFLKLNIHGDMFSFNELLLFPRSYSTLSYYTSLNRLVREDPNKTGIFGTVNSEPALAAAGLSLANVLAVTNNNKYYHTAWVEPTMDQINNASNLFRNIIFVDAPWDKENTFGHLSRKGWMFSHLHGESLSKIGQVHTPDSLSGDRRIFDTCRDCTELRSVVLLRH